MAEDRLIASEHWDIIQSFIGDIYRKPDLVIAPNGTPYLYRWHLLPRNDLANAYLHLQVADDPERPLHDHPYDNQSVILAGGYEEVFDRTPTRGWGDRLAKVRQVRAGATVHRKAEEAHRLRLLPGEPYAITLFTTGPRRREWGFWLEGGWVPWHAVTEGDYREGGITKWRGA